MLLNLSDVIMYEGKTFHREVEPDMKEFRVKSESFLIKDRSLLCLSAINAGHGMAILKGTMDLTFVMHCDRCLEEVQNEIALSFEKKIVVLDPKANGFGISNEEEDNSIDGKNFMEGYQLNVEQLIYSEIIINWPMKVLCDENCKGICKFCGQNLNEGTCACDDFVPDPRMAGIKELFNAYKEV